MSPARSRLDETIHSPVRFSIMAMLAKTGKAEFSFVRDTIDVSDSVLSKQATILEGTGYVTITKGHVGKRPRTWLEATATGHKAYQAHVAALRDIVAGADIQPR